MNLKKIISYRQNKLFPARPDYIDYPFYEIPFKDTEMTIEKKQIIEAKLKEATHTKKISTKPLIEETITNANGKQIHMLWVPHHHTDPSKAKEVERKINQFFDRISRKNPLSDNKKSVVFVECVDQLTRHNNTFRSREKFPKLLKQVENSAPNFPGENWKVIHSATIHQLPMFCPEPSQSHIIKETKKNKNIQALDILAYGFFMTNYKKSMTKEIPQGISLDDAIDLYLKEHKSSFKEVNSRQLKNDFKELINELWHGTFKYNENFFQSNKVDFELLMTPKNVVPQHIHGEPTSELLSNQTVGAIRSVPLEHGLIRDRNILFELDSALHTKDIVYLIYGYGHRQTLYPSIQYLMKNNET